MLSENYKKYFKMMMDKHGIKSLDQLSAEEKKKFFKAVDKSYKAKNEEVINENPAVIATAARMAIQNQQGKKVSVNTARQASYKEKDPQAHKKATSLFTKIVNKFKKKPKKTKPEPKKQSKSSAQKYADLYGGGAKVESIEEAMSNRVKKAIMVAVQMGGDMTGAIKKIEKIKKGLSKDKKVMQALRLANEGTIKKTIKKAMKKSKNNMTGKKNIVAPTGPQYRENVAPNHDGKAAPHGSGYKEVDEGKKQYGQKLTDDFFKSVKKFEQEVIVLGKMATKIRGDRTDEKIILKMYKKHMGPFIKLIRSWNETTQNNPHISEGKIQVQGIGMYDDKTLKKKILGMTKDLQKLAKNDEWSKSSENAIKALGRMWGAYQDYARNNESVTEVNLPMFKITYKDSLGRKKTDIMRAKNPKLAKRDFDALHKGRGFKILKVVKESVEESYDIWAEDGSFGYTMTGLVEAEYGGRKVKLGKPMQGDVKKFKVYVKNPKGNVVKVNFGQGGDAKGGTMRIRKSNPKARANFRARHNCDSPGPRHKARYWSCRKW